MSFKKYDVVEKLFLFFIVVFFGMILYGFFVIMAEPVHPAQPAGFYPRAGTVIERDDDANLITIEDAAGFLWVFEAEDIFLGENVAMLMHDNGTPGITDDYVVRVC